MGGADLDIHALELLGRWAMTWARTRSGLTHELANQPKAATAATPARINPRIAQLRNDIRHPQSSRRTGASAPGLRQAAGPYAEAGNWSIESEKRAARRQPTVADTSA